MLHGHCHGNMNSYNGSSSDLRYDAGIDGEMANYKLLSLEETYEKIMTKKIDRR